MTSLPALRGSLASSIARIAAALLALVVIGLADLRLGAGYLLGPLYLATVIVSAYWGSMKESILIAIAASSTWLFVAVAIDLTSVGTVTFLVNAIGRTSMNLFGAITVAKIRSDRRELKRQRDELAAAHQRVEELSRAKSEFLAAVSHELRSPLVSIQGFSEMIRDEVGLNAAAVKDFADDINRDAKRLGRMISELLDLDRLEAGRMTLHLERTGLNDIVSETAALFRPEAEKHPITLRLDEGLPPVMVDPDRVVQVVTNLLSNAIKYSPEGGAVEVVTSRDGSEAQLTVRDQGMGVPQELLATIVERYARVDAVATRAIRGTGLGLPIVRQILQLHGGRVWATSEPGDGSTFYVRLPLAADST